ncbi:hypothetical protein N7468_003169 [Penicillium chermesinum]|uniref:G-patch domain-containing protein n=1 Tax=Penicillium chermesinum TaxID=63820 RepID=A0A9W9P654_9EURO|nr:uncharacterized protein N7468_003169 [Penicillium chermesinum]KAJ5238550.1 hypothetical protein N7468_003169 [Penicillium chermesinum]
MASDPAQPKGLRTALYPHLLEHDNSEPGVISRAPVIFKQDDPNAQPDEHTTKPKQVPAFPFQFTNAKRPQQKSKAKKPTLPKAPQQPTIAPARRQEAAAQEEQREKENREPEYTPQNPDKIYDPTRFTDPRQHKRSEEKIREIHDWKDHLHAHQMGSPESEDLDMPDSAQPKNPQFAPPMSFAPPPNLNDPAPPTHTDDASGEDAFAYLPLPDAAKTYSATISRSPVRYSPPKEVEAESEEPIVEEAEAAGDAAEGDAPQSSRPGQKGFAERLLTKYGWTKGSGLGASGEGIKTPLQVKTVKQKKRPDSEGGGFATRAGQGKIIGGQKGEEKTGKFGRTSEVIIVKGMLDGMDVEAELVKEGGGLMQEIGDECTKEFGDVERVFVASQVEGSVPVFVHFRSSLSALRAVNALDGHTFLNSKGAVSARFYELEKFEQGIYSD